MRLIFSPVARRDVQDILRYTERMWGREQRRRYRTLLEDGIERLTSHPELGQMIDAGADCTRRLVIGSHVIVYRVEADTVQIARIVHHRRESLLISVEIQ